MKTTILLLTTILILSCSNTEKEKKIVYETNKQTEKKDSDKKKEKETNEFKLISGLPFQLDSANTRIYPIGKIKLRNERGSKVRFASYSGSYAKFFAIGSFGNREYYGHLDNLIFEKLKSGKKYLLTSKKLKIVGFYQLYNENNIPLKYLLFKIVANDSNKDNKLNENDVSNLYLSGINGENFTQISNKMEDLIDWTYTDKNLLFFRTIEDTNKNGELEENDILHIYKTDLKTLKTVEVLKTELKKLNE